MPPIQLKVALIHEVFFGETAAKRLDMRLEQARGVGARLAVLPELPLNRWAPATRRVDEGDAEQPGGRRQQMLAEAARRAGIALLGGAIVRDPRLGARVNRALLFDASGRQIAGYDKLHLPSEEGFWESAHYEPGRRLPQRIDGLGMPLGIQVCSDLQRPQGSQLLSALGVEVILAPRATPSAGIDNWRTVIRAIAMTTATYVVSVNRPAPEGRVAFGGPSLVAAPDGTIVSEATDPVTVVGLEHDAVERARIAYPGYLAVRADLYAGGWTRIAGG